MESENTSLKALKTVFGSSQWCVLPDLVVLLPCISVSSNSTSLICFCWGLFSGLGMVFHNLYSLRAKGQNPLCGKPSAVVHSHTPGTD